MGRETFVTQVFFSPDTDNSDDDDDDDFLSTAKDQSKYLGKEEEDGKIDPTSFMTLDTNATSKKSKKVITKAAVAKKLAKMNIQVNTRVEFNVDGEQLLDPTKQQVQYDNILFSSHGNSYYNCGFGNIIFSLHNTEGIFSR